MASGNYAHKPSEHLPVEQEIAKKIPLRATRHLPALQESVPNSAASVVETLLGNPLNQPLATPERPKATPKKMPSPRRQIEAETSLWHSMLPFFHQGEVTSGYNKANRYGPQTWVWVLCLIGVICFLTIPLSVGVLQRSVSSYISNDGQVYSMQVGGKQANTWQHDPQQNIPSQSGPYGVLGNPSITVDFINQVLSNYHSPAAGKGQSLYDLGQQYGIDPAFALAFFMHESSFGTKGEATKSLSLGNLRCIPNFRCEDNFAQFDNWEDGFKAWYQLIRNLYVAQWGLTTVDQIIPRYAPTSDNNNEQGYIAALKHAIDTWHAGQIIVS